MIIPELRSATDPEFPRAWEILRLLLTATINGGGIRHADNVGPSREFRYLAARVPFAVKVDGLNGPPRKIVANAIDRTTGKHEDGCRVIWKYSRAGSIEIYDVDVSATSNEYDVTLDVHPR